MTKKIKFSLNESDISRAIEEIERYRRDVENKTAQLTKLLAEAGLKEASIRFTTAIYDGVNDVQVRLDETDRGYAIVAEGNAVAFIEFGAGVYHNPSEPYPNDRPDGIVGIGEYGQGKGSNSAWGYYDESGDLVITHGNPAAMPMWYASEEMRNLIERIAKEVFG